MRNTVWIYCMWTLFSLDVVFRCIPLSEQTSKTNRWNRANIDTSNTHLPDDPHSWLDTDTLINSGFIQEYTLDCYLWIALSINKIILNIRQFIPFVYTSSSPISSTFVTCAWEGLSLPTPAIVLRKSCLAFSVDETLGSLMSTLDPLLEATCREWVRVG